MSLNPTTPWHKASYDNFIYDDLPQLLAERLPLADYQVTEGLHACSLHIALNGGAQADFTPLPRPDEAGLFNLADEPCVVIPTASSEDLDTAEIACVGEQLLAFVKERLGQASNGITWNEEVLRTWLPLNRWVDEFLHAKAQRLDTTNWLSRHTHLRRLIIPNIQKVIHQSQFGRVCPYETPESQNMGKVFTISVGAEIRDKKIIVMDERPEAGLGLSTSTLPFLEHNDPNRLLMAANMLRQAIVPVNAEPAWVQTGNEPDATGFWCGRNLLTAFVSWGEGTSEDGIILSESAARRMNDPFPVEPGDKLANRHGAKGVVSQILPDEQMPHLADGTPIELVYNFPGLRTRMHIGQVREAIMSRIARAEGKPAIVPPFEAPTQDELRRRLVQAGLPETGMEILTRGKDGPALEQPSTVGWIYWNRLAHLAQRKIHASIDGTDGQSLDELDAIILRELGAVNLLAEMMNTRTIRHRDASTLAQRVAQSPVELSEPPTPLFATLVERLRMAGIQVELQDDELRFHFASPEGKTLKLAHPLPHPWLPEHQIDSVGIPSGKEAEQAPFTDLVEANARLERLLSSQVPERLVKEAEARLEIQLKACFDALVPPDGYWPLDEKANAAPGEIPPETGNIPELLRIDEPQCFSGRAVAAPGIGLHLDQVGLPEELCWKLFGPFVARELKDASLVNPEDPRAVQVLESLMAQQWVIIHRSPALTPTALLAFYPVRDPARVIRLNPIVCDWLNADFDGDQVAVHLPITAASQRECQELLSVNGHLQHNPTLIKTLLPSPEVLWGLAYQSLTQTGRQEIARTAGVAPETLGSLLTQANFTQLMETVLRRDGVQQALEKLEALTRFGYQAARDSGASISPFIGSSLQLPSAPSDDNLATWEAYSEELSEFILASTDYANLDLGPQLLDAHVRPWNRRSLVIVAGKRGVVMDENGQPFIVKHGNSEGLTAPELLACTVGARQGLAQVFIQSEQLVHSALTRNAPTSLTVLSRARRARQPGIVFARAAANQEIDPLEDAESRLLVGLPLDGHHQ